MILPTLLVGVVIALIFTEIAGILPGGIIVPAALALSMDRPGRVLATVLAACLALVIYKGLASFFLIYGRRRFVLMLLLGALIGQLWVLAWPRLAASSIDFRVIGWIIPGLLAYNLERQKVLPTLASLAAATVLTYFVIRLAGMLG
jgi:poly-gamma-glutamate biosynthesis protein PgsC/CapC